MKFLVMETRKVNRDGESYGEPILELRMTENSHSESYDIVVTSVKSIEEARELVLPNNIMETLTTNLSETEINAITLPNKIGWYTFYDETFKIDNPSNEETNNSPSEETVAKMAEMLNECLSGDDLDRLVKNNQKHSLENIPGAVKPTDEEKLLEVCEHCGKGDKLVKYYEVRDKVTDAFVENIHLCDECVKSYEEENDEFTVSLPVS